MITQLQLPAMPLRRAARDGKPEAMTTAGLARRAEEGFAKSRQQFRRNAGAVVTYAQA